MELGLIWKHVAALCHTNLKWKVVSSDYFRTYANTENVHLFATMLLFYSAVEWYGLQFCICRYDTVPGTVMQDAHVPLEVYVHSGEMWT